MKKIIVTADLGHFKAYQLSQDAHRTESPRLELIESYDTIDAHLKDSDRMSDAGGCFGSFRTGTGERHTANREAERRLLRLTADSINSLIKKEKCANWSLAAGKRINNTLIEFLAPDVKNKLDKNLKSDLTKVRKADLLDRFEFE